MTDRSPEPGRIDLRSIDEPEDPLQAQRVVGSVLARLAADRASPDGVLASVATYSRPLLAAAAVLLVIATGTLIFTHGRIETGQPASVLAAWAETSHVPSNGELLAAFQGYER